MTMPKTDRAVGKLIQIMATLRSPNGCPWDAEQTPESLKAYILEETYEVLEAIDHGSPADICDELGDLLLQVIFQARIFEERGAFDFGDVANGIAEKLVRRHPHVFDDQPCSDIETLNAQWDRIKVREKQEKGEKATALSGIPRDLPALLRARKLSEKASRAGFGDFDREYLFNKTLEGLHKLGQSSREGDQQSVERELGNILFALVNLGRLEQVDAEEALRSTLNQFTLRFEQIEKSVATDNSAAQGQTITHLDTLWEKSGKPE